MSKYQECFGISQRCPKLVHLNLVINDIVMNWKRIVCRASRKRKGLTLDRQSFSKLSL